MNILKLVRSVAHGLKYLSGQVLSEQEAYEKAGGKRRPGQTRDKNKPKRTNLFSTQRYK